ncbi:flagellar protein FlaG [Paenibacillus sp. MB22_1]|jgi:flagellar protein FlaG|uniref:flagellar protein FlaG n=1 Tax=Paenibacillus sp. MB22_1 TaxID=3383121 RepID=UPI0039A19607
MNVNRLESLGFEKITSTTAAYKLGSSIKGIRLIENHQVDQQQDKSKQELEKMQEQIKKLNESIAASGKELHFKYNEEVNQLYVEVIDSKTKEVLSSLPPEFLIELSKKMKEMIGLFIDERL